MAEKLLNAGTNQVANLAVSPSHIYWGSGVTEPAHIGRASIDGGAVEPEWLTLKGGGRYLEVRGIAVDASHVYFAVEEEIAEEVFLAFIGRVRLDGTGLEEHWLPVAFGEAAPGPLAVTASHIYMAWTNKWVGRWNIDGTEPITGFVKTTIRAKALALSSSHIYCARDGEFGFYCLLDGTEGVGGTIPWATGMAVSGAHLFYNSGRFLGRSALDGSEPSIIEALAEVACSGLQVQGAYGYYVIPTDWIGRALLLEPELKAGLGAPRRGVVLRKW